MEPRYLLAQLPGLGDATRQHLSIFVNGVIQGIPANIGVAGNQMQLVHTRDSGGVIHVQPTGVQPPPTELPTLGDFFDTWRERAGTIGNRPNAIFNANQIFSHVVDATHTLRFYVNGVLNTEYENHRLGFNEELVIVYDSIENMAPQLAELPDVQMFSGAPLAVGLDAYDTDFDPLVFDVQSDNPQLHVSLLKGRNLRMSVENYGDMVFQLFEQLAPRTSGRIAGLAESGFYDDIVFHRVVNNFVIQAGDPTATGTGGSDLGDFDDEFVADIQHTSRGVLSMAKTTDDTNDSQFFITEGPTRHLDFNHSIFGKLIEGENVREAISNVPTDARNLPQTPVRIETMTVFENSANRTLLLKPADGATGTAKVTVTVSDGRSVAQRSFNVAFQPDVTTGIFDSPPFLAPLPRTVYVVDDQELRLPLVATDVENNPVQFQVRQDPNLTTTLSTINANTVNTVAETQLTIQRKQNFTGSSLVTVWAQPTSGATNDARRDVQQFLVQVITGPLPGDANGDNQVGIADLQMVRAAFGSEGQNLPADVNKDGRVNVTDLQIVRGAFGLARETAAAPASSLTFSPQGDQPTVEQASAQPLSAFDAVFQTYAQDFAAPIDYTARGSRTKRCAADRR